MNSGDGATGEQRPSVAVAEAPAGAAVDSAATRPPDFFVVGQPKSGTTALFEMLRRHPQVFMPAIKESWYFGDELHERTPPRPGGTPQTLAEYLALFAPAGSEQLRGEASALYLWSRTAATQIAGVAPEAKIIAILREPASLLHSLHLQFLRSYVEVETDFRKALALERERSEGRSIPPNTFWPGALMYSEHVRYVEQLRRYREAFGEQRMLVLIYDDFRADNEAAVRRVLRFLGADDSAAIEVMDANHSVGVRSRRVHGIVNAVSVGNGPLARAAKATVRTLLPADIRRQTRQRLLFGSPPEPEAELMAELRLRFRDEVLALSEYLDRDLLSLWGHDGAG
jgi:hypothetical protein